MVTSRIRRGGGREQGYQADLLFTIYIFIPFVYLHFMPFELYMMCSITEPKINNSQHKQNISVPEVVLGLYKRAQVKEELVRG